MFWKDSTIEQRVMQVVKARIRTAQETYEAKCALIDEECESEIKKIEDKRISEKEENAEQLVKEILAR